MRRLLYISVRKKQQQLLRKTKRVKVHGEMVDPRLQSCEVRSTRAADQGTFTRGISVISRKKVAE